MKKAEENQSNLIDDILKNTSLDVRVRVGVHMHFISKMGGSFFMPASEEGTEYKEMVRINEEALEAAEPIIELVLKEVIGWIEDGMPGEIENN